MNLTPTLSQKQFVVFKGGTAFNGIIRDFQKHFPHTTYIVPITDDGGSSKEIRRVFGGPSIGDLRSTLTRLSDESTPETCAVKKLLEYRLPNNDASAATAEWHNILEDNHPLYTHISSKYRGLIRCFLCKFEAERLYRISGHFDMRNGSIGNFFFSGTRMILGSLETAIFMYSSVAKIHSATQVLPIIDSNDRLGVGVRLQNNEVLIGQHTISHPAERGLVNKESYIPLPSPIKELFYVDKFKNVIAPQPHPEVINQIKRSEAIIYGMGSLWTSIIPSLILEGVGEAIASKNCSKIVLLNSCHDRETSSISALEYLHHIIDSLNRYGVLKNPPQAYITHLFIVEGTSIPIDELKIKRAGIKICKISQDTHKELSTQNKKYPVYSSDDLISSLFKIVDN